MPTSLDRSRRVPVATAARETGIPTDLAHAMVAEGFIPSLKVPGHRSVVFLSDMERAIKLLETPATNERIHDMT